METRWIDDNRGMDMEKAKNMVDTIDIHSHQEIQIYIYEWKNHGNN